MTRMTVAEAVVECLLAEDITHVFNLSGTQILPILDVVDRHPKMRTVLTRHEQGAGLMALGYAHASRRPALCMATVGPGAVNLTAGAAAAHKAHIPLIAITGMHDRWLHQRDVLQEQDQVALYKPITKWSYMLSTGEKVPELLRRAFRIATTGIPGPVHLAIPQDVQMEEIDFIPMEPWQYRSPPRTDCNLSSLDRIVALLSQARSPAFLVGPEVVDEEATPELISAAEALGVPVATSRWAGDSISYSHPLAAGSIGGAGSEVANSVVREADVLLAVGMHFDFMSTEFRYTIVSENTKIIQVSRFGELLGSVFPTAIAVEGSSRTFLRALAREAQAGRLPRRIIDLTARKREWEEKRRSWIDTRAKPIRAGYVVRAIRQALPEDGILVTDGGSCSHNHTRRHFDFLHPNTYFHPREYGSIGVGLPYAIGVKMARPNQEVVLVAGDGGFMLNVGELETAVREKVKLTAVVFNDHGLSSERAHEKHDYPGRYFATEYGDVNFAKVAEGMGAYSIRVTEPSELPDALRLAISQDRISVVDVLTDPEDLGTPVAFSKEVAEAVR